MYIYISENMGIWVCQRIALGDVDNAPLDTDMLWVHLLLITFVVSVNFIQLELTDFCRDWARSNSDHFCMYIADQFQLYKIE